jgi:nucleoside-diphosphate-sugar epimerase
VRGTRNLIDFARDSANASRLKFIFTSSVASANSWGSSQGPYPEETILDARFAVGNGYGESKYVSERVIFPFFSFCIVGSSLELSVAPC